jgi:hypothetical protein
VCGATCLLTCDVQVWCTEMVDSDGEGLVETCCANGLVVVKDEREAWTEGQRRLED